MNSENSVVLASVAFWAPVKYIIAGDDGKPEIVKARARFKRLKTRERRELDARMAANNLNKEASTALRARLDDPSNKLAPKVREALEASMAAEPIDDAGFLALMLVDWDLKDKRGEVIHYSPAKLAEVCEEWDGFETALAGSYFDAIRASQDPEVIAKNSEAPSATTS